MGSIFWVLLAFISGNAQGADLQFTPALCGTTDYRCSYDEQKNVNLIEHFKGDMLLERRQVRQGRAAEGFSLDYTFDGIVNRNFPMSFRIFNEQGQVSRARRFDEPLDCGNSKQNFSEIAIVMDTGAVDVRHPEFKNKILINSQEKWNGKDDDGNGLIDDCQGYTIDEWSTNAQVISPMTNKQGKLIELGGKPLLPDVDHSTITMSIAARGIRHVGFLPIAGDLRKDRLYDEMLKTIAEHQVRFVNVSLGVMGLTNGDDGEGLSSPTANIAYLGMRRLTETAKNTLFVTAAGNGAFVANMGLNIDRIPLYPAAFWFPNILTVAAIESSSLETQALSEYRLAPFSNVGLAAVDLAAPGTEMRGALAGGTIGFKARGTSFAAPFVLNLALKVAERYPQMSIYQIKELFLKTVYIPDIDLALQSGDLQTHLVWELESNPRFFPVRSGGVIFPERVMAAAKLFNSGSGLTLEQACLRSRELVRAPGEPELAAVQSQLLELWKLRNIDVSSQPETAK